MKINKLYEKMCLKECIISSLLPPNGTTHIINIARTERMLLISSMYFSADNCARNTSSGH